MPRLLDGGNVEHKPLKLLSAESKFQSLMSRIWMASALSVAAAVVFGIGFAYPLVRGAAETQAREVLSEQADVVVELIFQNDSSQHAHGRGNIRRDIGPGVVVLPLFAGEMVPRPLSEVDAQVLFSGNNLSGVIETNEGRFFVEGRPLSLTQAIVLVQRDNAADAPAFALMSKMITASGAIRLITGRPPWPSARRCAIALLTSCSIGRKNPGASANAINHIATIGLKPSCPRACCPILKKM